MENWPGPGEHDDDKKRLLQQVKDLNGHYPGGLEVRSVWDSCLHWKLT